MRQREPAICIRATDYSETSQVVHLLTRGAGVVRLLAKGTKRPKSKSQGAIDLLAEGDLVFITSGRETLGTLVEFTETVSHVALRREARRLNTALYMIELAGLMLAEADPHPEVFDLLHNALARLGQPGSPAPAVLAFFQWRLLRHVGLLGDLRSCVACGGTLGAKDARDLHFSSRQGGFLCAACAGAAAEKYRVDAAAVAGLRTLAAAQGGSRTTMDQPQADAVNRLLAYHIAQQLGRTPRMLRYVLEAIDG
jgi:DNA repair protein RecO (recombination protein O)